LSPFPFKSLQIFSSRTLKTPPDLISPPINFFTSPPSPGMLMKLSIPPHGILRISVYFPPNHLNPTEEITIKLSEKRKKRKLK
jgi:hypothetical protein